MRPLLLLSVMLLLAALTNAQGSCSCTFCVASTCEDFTSVCTELPGGGKTTCSSTAMRCSVPTCNSATTTEDASVCKQVCSAFGCPASTWACLTASGPSDDEGDEEDDDDATVVVGLEEDKDDNVCFHESTKITYQGRIFTLAQLLAGEEPECTVPHTPTARGVIISTDCAKTLRVTQTHLVATSTGFQLAHTLTVGDVLFDDMAGEARCTVTSVTREKGRERYFGLNCIHSELLADGLRTSTFGDFHTLPSWYMYYAGLALGPEAAARLGDAVAEAFYDALVF